MLNEEINLLKNTKTENVDAHKIAEELFDTRITSFQNDKSYAEFKKYAYEGDEKKWVDEAYQCAINKESKSDCKEEIKKVRDDMIV